MGTKQGNELKTFNHLYKELDGLYHDIALKCRLSDSAFLILYSIVELGDGCLQTEIAKSHSISKQTIHTSVKNLESKGYISFERGRGRDVLIYLTEAGKELVREKIMPVIEMENSALEGMSQEERHQLICLTEKYVRILRGKAAEIL